ATFILLSQVLLGFAIPALTLPAAILFRGLSIGVLALSTLRFLFWNARSKTALQRPYQWTWRINLVWVLACCAEMTTRAEPIRPIDFILPFIPMVVIRLLSVLQRYGPTDAEGARYISAELLFLLLILLPTVMVMWNWLSTMSSLTDEYL